MVGALEQRNVLYGRKRSVAYASQMKRMGCTGRCGKKKK